MKVIENKNFPNERDLYGISFTRLISCSFDGIEDGESALKEAHDVELISCYMDLRYPLWHDENMLLDNVTMTENARASLWYSNHITIKNSSLNGIKAVRECDDVHIEYTKIVSALKILSISNY